MARSRNIKPGFFINDQLAEIEPLGRLLFAGLWTIADREGRIEDRPKRIKVEVLPYDHCDVDQLLEELHKRNFIIRYQIDGERYIQITNWKKHQNPHVKEKKSTIPAPCLNTTSTTSEQEEKKEKLPEHEPEKAKTLENTQEMQRSEKHHTSTVQEPEKHTTNPADSFNLIPDSLNLIPSSLLPEDQSDDVNDWFRTDNAMETAKQEIERHYNKKKRRIAPLSPKEMKAIDNLLKAGIDKNQILNGIDQAFQYKEEELGEKINSFTYCATFIMNRHEQLLKAEQGSLNQKRNGQLPSSKPNKIPKAVLKQMEETQNGSSQTEMDEQGLAERQAMIQEKLRRMNELLSAKKVANQST